MSPDLLPPARCDFSHARKGKRPFFEGFFFEKGAVFPFSRGKNRISQGVENRGSLISVPLALREKELVRLQKFGNTPSTAGNSMTGSERRPPEPLLEKEASPAVLGGRILEMLWNPQMP